MGSRRGLGIIAIEKGLLLVWLPLFFSLQRMPGGVGKNKGAGGGGAVHQKSRHVKAKKQKKRFMRAKDPIQAVFMWGIQHSVRETSHTLSHSILPSFRSMKSRYSLSLLYY